MRSHGGSVDEWETDAGERPRRTAVDRLHWGSLADWSQLVRLPTAFTLLADVLAASIVAVGGIAPLGAGCLVLAASLCAYWAGMILNDVVDLEEDRQSRPTRPLAADRISPVIAGHVATGMLLVGPLMILAATTFFPSQPLWMGAAFACAVLLSLAVRAYDSPLKHTPLGPPLMGGCRALNILMVGCAMLSVNETAALPRSLVAMAIGMGLYITGVTLYARREERESSRIGLGVGLMFEVAGLVVIACLPLWADPPRAWTLDPRQGYPLLIGLIGLTVVNRGLAGVRHPVPRKVQLAVKHALLTLILLDAAIAMMWAGPWYGAAVAALLLPALAAAVRVRAT